MKHVAVYGFHDASLCLKDGDQYFIYEAERFFKKRYGTLTQTFADHEYLSHLCPTDAEFEFFFNYIKKKHNITYIENFHYSEIYPCDLEKIKRIFSIQNYKPFDHHHAHALSVYTQSPFDDCYIITYDGNGKNVDQTESSFVFWQVNSGKLQKIQDLQPWESFSLGCCYIGAANCLSSIKKKKNFGLPTAGKLMGLCSYGKPRDAWKPVIREFFDHGSDELADKVSDTIGFDIRDYDILSGQDELDYAATLQWAFEDKFFGIFNTLKIPKGANLCLSGGCALNILVNQKLHDMGYNLYIPPNSGDCGLTIGITANAYGDKNIDITYAGYEILDPNYTDYSFSNTEVSNEDIARMLYEKKKIIGFIYGRSECGPRALGNRSILCYPDILDLKNKLNAEIKFREWFRPFGAITKLENIDKYFENACPSPYMNFCPTLKEQYRFPAITHVDNTCRIQTITKEQHPDLYDILTEIEKMGGEGLLLNTSFNIKGKPILTRLHDAFEVCRQTKLDGFIYNNVYYNKEV